MTKTKQKPPKTKSKFGVLKKILIILLILALSGALFLAVANTIIIVSTDKDIYTLDEITDPESIEIPATGHAWGEEPVWTWNDDNSVAMATFKLSAVARPSG